ncbi:helix-turn-helix domain-containing protein [Caulobacter sp. UC70_42]|uniref:helix-turn-helix domain-containing protein n=1 Tax=Caulobacter sp. UC70_42 TaxID=3374551 RepID=UPI003757B27B
MDWKAVVGRNVRSLRHQRGFTQEYLAHEAEIDITYLRGIELGKKNPSLLVLVRICSSLSIDPRDILDSDFNSFSQKFLNEVEGS